MTTWVTDASRFSALSGEHIFENRAIRDFLAADRIFWIVASKGMGKTLLLRYKRDLMEAARGNSGLYILPQTKPLDYVRLPNNVPIEATNAMRERAFWKDLWETSITLAVLLTFPFHDLAQGEGHGAEALLRDLIVDEEMASDLRRALQNKPREQLNPSDVLVRLLQRSINDIQRLRRQSLHAVYNLYTRYVRSGVCVFIDSFDQALQETYPDELEIWIEGQLGLLLAAWEISRHNPHIKIYASIRQEAYAAFHDPNQQSIFGSMLMLRYTREELMELLDRSVRFFEKRGSLDELVGLKGVTNQNTAQVEDIFDYTYRHVIPTPRSFMVVGSEVSRNCSDLRVDTSVRESRFREVLNRCSTTEICQAYLLGEMSMFLPFLKIQENLACFFRLIHRNVLSQNALLRVYEQFNEGLKREGVWPGKMVHPFCELYNLGLLGSIAIDYGNNSHTQSFRKPYEFDWDMEEILPNSQFYFLHPALHALVYRYNPRYRVSSVLVGEGYPWREDYATVLRQEVLRVFISYSSKDRALAEGLAIDLNERLGDSGLFADIWFDRWRLRGGQWVQDTIGEALHACDLLIAIFTTNSVKSGWVSAEVRRKLDDELKSRRISVLPVLVDIDEGSLPGLLQSKQARRVRRRPKKGRDQDLKALTDDVLAVASQLGKPCNAPPAEFGL
jgi:hypothetical protein